MSEELFTEIRYSWPDTNPNPLANLQGFMIKASEELADGFWVQHLEDFDDLPPITGAVRAFNTLTYGNEHPTVIWSSETVKKLFLRSLKPETVRPEFHDGCLGFNFYGVPWIDKDSLRDTSWVVMLNENSPMNPRLNGCYVYRLPE